MNNLWKWRRRIPLLMIAGVISAVPNTFSQNLFTPDTADRITVVCVHPQEDTVEQAVTLPGSMEPFEKTALFAKATGFIETVHVDIGDLVKKEQVLVTLTIPEMMPDLRKAEADLAAAKAKLHQTEADAELAKITYLRLLNLQKNEPGAIAQQDVDVAAAQEKVAMAMVQSRLADIQVVEAQISRLKELMVYMTIRAPYDGIITKRYLDTGALIESGNSEGTPALEIMNISTLRLVVEIPDSIVPLIQEGFPAGFTFDTLPDQTFQGAITRLSGALKPDVRSMRVEIHYANEDRTLRPGMYAKVNISLQTLPNVLTLPATTLRPKPDGQGIWIIEQDAVRWIPVTVLIDDGAVVVVKGNLDSNTVVVESSSIALQEGQNVTIQLKDKES